MKKKFKWDKHKKCIIRKWRDKVTGVDTMEMLAFIEPKLNNLSRKDKLKELSLRSRNRRIAMKTCDSNKKDTTVNKELAEIQQNIYNTIE